MPTRRTPDPADMLTREEAARYLRASTTTVTRRQRDGSLPSYKVGRSVLFARSDLRSLVASARRAPDADD